MWKNVRYVLVFYLFKELTRLPLQFIAYVTEYIIESVCRSPQLALLLFNLD